MPQTELRGVEAGFSDPVGQSQRAFRAAMDALARPGLPVALESALAPPRPLTPVLAALGLALLDFEAGFWLAPSFARDPDAGRYLRFHTGAPHVGEPSEAAFAFVDLTAGDDLDLSRFAQGTVEYPDRSTTVLAVCAELHAATGLGLCGPGAPEFRPFGVAPLGMDFVARWSANRAAFPLGVDILFVAGSTLLGLPRSQRILAGG